MDFIHNILKKRRMLHGIMAFGLVALLGVSCNDVNFNGAEGEKGKMNVSLTDAPGDFEEVNIDVQGLRIHYTPASNDTVDADPADGEWIDLPMEPMKVNLLELTNGIDTLLTSADLDPGQYKELRLILSSENDVVVDGSTENLKVPSGQSSGYKIKFDTELEAGEELDVVVDFDAGRSVHKAGNSGKYILKPVLKAFMEDGQQVGSIAGAVDPASAEPNVFAVMDDDTSTTQAGDDGEFLLQGLDDGQYDLTIEPTDDAHADTTLTDITVEEGEETDVGIIELNEND